MRDRRKGLLLGAAALLAVTAIVHPSADIRIHAHDKGDAAPAKVQAAVDVGLFGFSLLVTWSRQFR